MEQQVAVQSAVGVQVAWSYELGVLLRAGLRAGAGLSVRIYIYRSRARARAGGCRREPRGCWPAVCCSFCPGPINKGGPQTRCGLASELLTPVEWQETLAIVVCPWLADAHRVGRLPHNLPTRCFSTPLSPPSVQWCHSRVFRVRAEEGAIHSVLRCAASAQAWATFAVRGPGCSMRSRTLGPTPPSPRRLGRARLSRLHSFQRQNCVNPRRACSSMIQFGRSG